MEYITELDLWFWVTMGITTLVTLGMIVVFWTCFSKYDPEKANRK